MVIGTSAAGIAALETLRRLGGTRARLTAVTDEPSEPYSRCLLPDLLAGKKSEYSIRLRPAGFFPKLGVEFLAGFKVVALHPEEKKVFLEDGRQLSFDRLLVATGASPVMPEVPGVDTRGVFALRTLQDAREMASLFPRVSRAMILGGGLVGLKAALALKVAGVPHVTVAVASPRLLTRQLDEEAAAMVERELTAAGLEFIYNAQPRAFVPGPHGTLAGVELADGRELPADLAVVAKGVRPNVQLVREAGGLVGAGIEVDRYLRTSLPDVFAAGDCVQVTDRLTGRKTNSALWTLAAEQGRYAAANMLGLARSYPPPLTRLNSARFGNLDVVAVGKMEGEEVLRAFEGTTGTYRRLVFEGDRLVGFILAGKVKGAGVYTALVKTGRPAWKWRHLLLEGRAGRVVLGCLPPQRRVESKIS
ncbi:NAD(P)/FAD-dependent oxidoreductase [Desulfovirgula thermocuniculi]|uniref:NAD(P)/FAD-dependent oxidoreductase n=1 Tax=Desulfovirgula thermocuniculi TaxID=348842 RepID=UPI001FDED13D|nr:FAD-dependent oxidoreductase [Desulfovirgula thermocuniculi]